ncbi:MAG: bis(5'-nucleosyl)-tetraphosphatase (symmetrical) YqeK [Anaeroplasmataceae bacterium]|nr:bis(5'-nucleosyl)-tetraphosphatase (symmetrical) YqeK [Anaeroplasmataceae bacterium]
MVKKKFTDANQLERYQHTLGVAKMAKALAKKYHVSVKKAMLASYLHDFCKYDSKEQVDMLLREEDKAVCQNYPVLYHSYASAEYYKKNIGNDEEVYQAIRNHVWGRVGMSRLEEIILISDYTEENRMYPNCIACREILLSGKLNSAIYYSTKYTIEFLQKQNLKPHPMQLEVYHYYERLCEV